MLVATTLFGLACARESAESAETGDQIDPIELPDLCPVIVDDVCLYLSTCLGAQFSDLDHCRQQVDCYGLAEVEAADRDGRIDYDPHAVAQCHQRFVDDPCNFRLFFGLPNIYEALAPCGRAIRGRVEEGDECLDSAECMAGLFCDKDDAQTCPGACRALANVGESCATIRCDKGFVCDREDRCRESSTVGQACAAAFDCPTAEDCDENRNCTRENLWCDIEQQRCSSAPDEGEACGWLEQAGGTFVYCEANHWCDADVITRTGQCRVLGKEGAPCKSNGCEDGLFCADYSVLESENLGTCSKPRSLGEPCEQRSECKSDLWCDENQECALAQEVGESCSAISLCASGLACLNDRCATLVFPGDACDEELTTCSVGICRDGVCENYAKIGESCATDGDCMHATCISGICEDTSICNPPI
jgi:hypothetical protein